MAPFIMGRPGNIWRRLTFVHILEVKLLTKNFFTVMIAFSGSILIKRLTRLLKTLMKQAQAVFLRNFGMKSKQFHSVMDPVLFAKVMETIITKKFSFALQNTRERQSVLFVSRFAGTNMDIIFIWWLGLLFIAMVALSIYVRGNKRNIKNCYLNLLTDMMGYYLSQNQNRSVFPRSAWPWNKKKTTETEATKACSGTRHKKYMFLHRITLCCLSYIIGLSVMRWSESHVWKRDETVRTQLKQKENHRDRGYKGL